MSLLPNWVTRVAKKVTDYVGTLLTPPPEKIEVTSDRAAEKVLKAMEKAATTGTAAGLHSLVRGAKKLIDYQNGAFYMPRLVRVLADGLATPPVENTQAADTYRKHATLLMEQGCRSMVSEAMGTYKAMAETGDDPLAAKNISENMLLVLEASQNSKQLACALALSTGAIKMMRAHGDVAGTTAAVSGLRVTLKEKAHPIAKTLKGHFEGFITKLYKTTSRPTSGFSLDMEVLTAEHQAAFAAARERRMPEPPPVIKPPISPLYQAKNAPKDDMSATTAALEALPPAATIATPRPAFVRAAVTPEVSVPDVGPEDKGLSMSFAAMLTPQPAPSSPVQKAATEGRAYPHGRITDQGIYATKPVLRDDFTTTSVNDKINMFADLSNQAEPELQKPVRPFPRAVLDKMVGVYQWNNAKLAFDLIAKAPIKPEIKLHDDNLLDLPVVLAVPSPALRPRQMAVG